MTADELRAAHDECAAAVRRHPKRLRAYLVFHPHLLDQSIAEMKRVLEASSPFAGFKLHGALHQYTPDGPNYRPLFEFAHEHGLPVLYHYAGEVDRSAAIAKRYPRMNLILAHLGGGGEAVIPFLKSVPNLYIDTCSSTLPHRWSRVSGVAGGSRRKFCLARMPRT